MSDPLNHRLNQILPKLTSDEFLCARGIGNEIAFYIFDYEPEDELHIREYIPTLLHHLQRTKPGIRVAHIKLFDFLIEYLKERNLLIKSFEMQRKKGNTALLNALQGILHEEKISKRFGDVAKPEEHDLVLVSGVGAAYPLLRAHTLLSNLHTIMGQTPMVMFYPGKYDTQTLRLFGKTTLTSKTVKRLQQATNYYRAFRLIE